MGEMIERLAKKWLDVADERELLAELRRRQAELEGATPRDAAAEDLL